ncbi:MAG: hypothetical protein E7Z76_06935, partial [Methanobrevibacter sp.]|nr:hypothetical protein [Methanobrevibacter sp.]
IEITKQADGTLIVTKIAESGVKEFDFTGTYGIVISESHENFAALSSKNIAVGQYVIIDGNTATGVATVKFYAEKPELPEHVHTEEVIPAVEATCTEKGLTEGKKCSVCGEILVKQEEVAALGHKEEVIPGKEATATETGLTEGKKCSVCGEILVEQKEIPALGEVEYKVYFKGEGNLPGSQGYASISELADEIVALFNSTGAADAKVTTKESFQSTTHPNVKYVFSNAEVLAKYKWMFEFIKADLKANQDAGVEETSDTIGTYSNLFDLLDKLIAGDTTAVNGDYINGRSCLRQFIHEMINAETPENAGHSSYAVYSSDFSTPEMIAKILTASKTPVILKATDKLPVPTREGYTFLGWFDANGNKVENVSEDCELTAKWEENKPAEPQSVIQQILDAAKDLADKAKLEGKFTVTGEVTEITSSYNSQYNNVSFMVSDGVAAILVYRASGDEAKNVAAGDTVTVTGEVQNYGGTIEIVNGTISARVAGEGSGDVEEPEKPELTVDIVLDFVTNFGTYASKWTNSYAAHTVTNADLGVANELTVEFSRASKQTSTITDKPVVAANKSTVYVTVSLANETASGAEFDLQQWTNKTFSSISIEYFDGTNWVECGSSITTPGKLSASFGQETNQFRLAVTTTQSKNVQLGVTAISIDLK